MIAPKTPIPSPSLFVKILHVAVDFLQAMFTPPQKKETPQDVAERNRWRREFTDHIDSRVEAIEQQIVSQLRSYANYLVEITQNELSKYKINTMPFVHQVELLSMQIPGTIAAEVSRHVTDSDAGYCRICRMISGAEKEQAMQTFMQEIIEAGVEKCSRLSQQVFDQIETDLITMLQDRVDQSYQQLERTRQDIECLVTAVDDRQEQERLKAQAELISASCDFIEGLFDEKEGQLWDYLVQ